MVLNKAQIKSMTGNDTLNARFLHENSFDFKPQFKLYVNTNYLPAITDMTLFSSGRIVIIPFDRHFEEWEQEQNLKAEFSRNFLWRNFWNRRRMRNAGHRQCIRHTETGAMTMDILRRTAAILIRHSA